jgi:hypothetical protein
MDQKERISTLFQDDEEDYGTLEYIIIIVKNYAWLVAVVFGIPGNILSVLIAARKRNRALSPCVYIIAMAVVDTAQLIQISWFYPFFFSELGKKIFRPRDTIYK